MLWFRFYHEFMDDPKIAMMTDSDQLIWVKALCLASNNSPRGLITLSDEEICWKLRITQESWRHAIDKFRAKGMIEHCESGYKITNWDKRQYKSDSSAERVAKHRAKKEAKKRQKKTLKVTVATEKQDCNVTVTPPDTDTEYRSEQNTDPDQKKREEAIALTQKPGISLSAVQKFKRAIPESWGDPFFRGSERFLEERPWITTWRTPVPEYDESYVEFFRKRLSETPHYRERLKREANRADVLKRLNRANSGSPQGIETHEQLLAEIEEYKPPSEKKQFMSFEEFKRLAFERYGKVVTQISQPDCGGLIRFKIGDQPGGQPFDEGEGERSLAVWEEIKNMKLKPEVYPR